MNPLKRSVPRRRPSEAPACDGNGMAPGRTPEPHSPVPGGPPAAADARDVRDAVLTGPWGRPAARWLTTPWESDVYVAEARAVKKTVVGVDLCGFSDIGRELDAHCGPLVIHALKRQIEGFIWEGLRQCGVNGGATQLPYVNTGDGAIIGLDSAQRASDFAEALLRACAAHNQDPRRRTVDAARRRFRVGIWTDVVVLERRVRPDGAIVALEMAGIAVANAVRLQDACSPGEVLINTGTWAELPKTLRRLYGPEEQVHGKRGERFLAHRRCLVESI